MNPQGVAKAFSALPKLRQQHREILMIELPISDKDFHSAIFFFRPLTAQEHQDFFMAASQGEDVSEAIVEHSMIWPKTEDFSFHPIWRVPAGYFAAVADAIVATSSYSTPNELRLSVLNARTKASNMDNLIDHMIMRAFPAFTPFDVEHMPFSTRMELLARAEMMLGQEFPIGRLLKPPKKGPNIDWDNIPKLSEADVAMMSKSTNRTPKVMDQVAQQAAQRHKNRRAEKALPQPTMEEEIAMDERAMLRRRLGN